MHLDSNLAVELNRRLGSHRTDSHILWSWDGLS